MNWDALGAIAEILGALGVIITIAYLAVQVRQNSRQVASSLAESIRNGINETTRIMASNPETARVFRIGVQNPKLLDESERYQFDALLTLTFYGQQQAFVNGQIDSYALEWILQLPGARYWWTEYSHLLSREFGEYVNNILEKLSHTA